MFTAPASFTHSLDVWALRHSSTNELGLRTVTFGEHGFVAAGDLGIILRSPDGADWTILPSPVTDTLQGAAFGNHAYVIVANSGAIIACLDGTNWTTVFSSEPYRYQLSHVAFGNGRFLAAGMTSEWDDRGPVPVVLVSEDGLHWTERSSALSLRSPIDGLAYCRNTFLLAGGQVILSSPDAAEWTETRQESGLPIRGFAFGGGEFVGVGGFAGGFLAPARSLVLTSHDGRQWSAHDRRTDSPLSGVAYGNGFFVAGGPGIFASEDGDCWHRRHYEGSWISGVCFGEGTFVAVESSGQIWQSAAVSAHSARLRLVSCEPVLIPEESGSATLRVRRGGDTNRLVHVSYRTVDGTAVAGVDYRAASGTLSFLPGETERTITVQTLDDDRVEGPETFGVILQDPTDGADLGEPDFTTFVVVDDDSDHLDQWTTQWPTPPACCLARAAYGNGTFVAVGGWQSPIAGDSRGVILYSPDGFDWKETSPSGSGWLYDVCWGGGSFIAVCQAQSDGPDDPLAGRWVRHAIQSDDGRGWHELRLPIRGPVQTVAYGNGRFVAVAIENPGDNSRATLLTSVDSVHWTRTGQSVASADRWTLAFGGGTFLTLGRGIDAGSGQTTNLAWISTNGTEWALHPVTSIRRPVVRLAYGNGIWVGVTAEYDSSASQAVSSVVISANGIQWSEAFVGTGLLLADVDHNDGAFLAVGSDYGLPQGAAALLTSSDGIHWSRETNTTVQSPGGVTDNSGLSVIVGSGIWTSTNHTEWNERLPGNPILLDITHDDGLFVAVGSVIVTSSDGAEWTLRTTTSPSLLRSVAHGNGNWVAVAGDGSVALSPDGIEWTRRTALVPAQLQGVTYGGGAFVAIGATLASDGSYWTNRVFVSPDGNQWTPTFSAFNDWRILVDITHANGLFVAVGSGGLILTSADGITWTERSSGTGNPLNGIAFADGLFVAVGGFTSIPKWVTTAAVILTSSDGLTWTERNAPAPWQLNAVAHNGELFVAAGTAALDPWDRYQPHDNILTSSDGISWDVRPVQGGTGLTGIASGNGRFVAIGDGSRIVRPGMVLRLDRTPSPANANRWLTLSSEVGRQHAVEVSTNLADWTVLTNVVGARQRVPIQDPEAANRSWRFYRARELPSPPAPP
jgi:hypothetical protein